MDQTLILGRKGAVSWYFTDFFLTEYIFHLVLSSYHFIPILFAAEVLVGSLARFNPYHLDRSCSCVVGTWNKNRGVLDLRIFIIFVIYMLHFYTVWTMSVYLDASKLLNLL